MGTTQAVLHPLSFPLFSKSIKNNTPAHLENQANHDMNLPDILLPGQKRFSGDVFTK